MKTKERGKFPGAIAAIALAAVALFIVSCSSDYVGNDEFEEKFEEKYNARQPSLESRKEQFGELFDEFFKDRYGREIREKEFADFLDELQENKPAEPEEDPLGLLRRELLDGGHDKTGLTLALSDPEVMEEAAGFSRQIYGTIDFVAPLDAAVDIFGVQKGGGEVELPDGARISAEGMVTIPVAGARSAGFLGPQYVLGINNAVYAAACGDVIKNFKPGIAEYSVVNVFALPKAGEADWKTEMLFSGPLSKMCSGAEGAPRYYERAGTVVFKRPETKTLPVPLKDVLGVASFSALGSGGAVLYAADLALGLDVWMGKAVTLVSGDSQKPPAMFFVGTPQITPVAKDAGAAVYYVERDAEDPVRLVGFIFRVPSAGLGMVMPADFLLNGIEEFPHEIIE